MEGVWNRKKWTRDHFPSMRSNSELLYENGLFWHHWTICKPLLFLLFFLASFPLFLTLLWVNFTSEPLTTKQKPFNTPRHCSMRNGPLQRIWSYDDKQYTRHFFALLFLLLLQYVILQFSYRPSSTRTTAGHDNIPVLWTEMTSGICCEKLHRFCSERTNSPNSVFGIKIWTGVTGRYEIWYIGFYIMENIRVCTIRLVQLSFPL
jgi:hypothetical protein